MFQLTGAFSVLVVTTQVIRSLVGMGWGLGPMELIGLFDGQYLILLLCYLPLGLWSPLLSLVAMDFYRRRIKAGAGRS